MSTEVPVNHDDNVNFFKKLDCSPILLTLFVNKHAIKSLISKSSNGFKEKNKSDLLDEEDYDQLYKIIVYSINEEDRNFLKKLSDQVKNMLDAHAKNDSSLYNNQGCYNYDRVFVFPPIQAALDEAMILLRKGIDPEKLSNNIIDNIPYLSKDTISNIVSQMTGKQYKL